MCAAALWLHCSLPSNCDISSRELFNPIQPVLPPKPVFVEEESETPLVRYQRHSATFPKQLREAFESVLHSDYPEDTVDITDAKLNGEQLKQLFHLLRHYNKVSTIVLFGNKLGVDDMRELQKALEAQECLEDLDLGDCGLEEEAVQVLCETLPRLVGLRQLRISRNSLSPSSLSKIFKALKNSKLTCLWISHNTMDSESSQALSELLETTKLEILCLTNTSFTAQCAKPLLEALRKCRTLKQLYLNNNPLYSEGMKLLSLKLPWSLEVFDIAYVGMGIDAARTLGLGISSLRSLHEVRLDRNSIQDEGLQFLAGPLSQHTEMAHFSAAQNDLSPFSSNLMVVFLKKMPRLRTLRLAHNRLGSDARCMRAYIMQIRHLDLRQCRVYSQLDIKRDLKYALLDLTTDVDF